MIGPDRGAPPGTRPAGAIRNRKGDGMSLLSLPRTYGNLRRASTIAMVLTRHGFGHILSRMGMAQFIPGALRLRMAVREPSKAQEPMPERLVQVMQDLGPTFVKFGQLLATRPDLLPPEYLRALARLQDRVEPFPSEKAVEIIESSLHRSLEEVFASFDREPIASGSLGQVHTGTLRDGRPVVIKVKRPATDARVRDDLDILIWLADRLERYVPEVAVLRPRALCEEFARGMRRELDFVSEASYTAKFHQEFADNLAIVIPEVHWDLVSRDVLVLDRISGIPFSQPESLPQEAEERRRLANDLGNAFMHQFLISGLFHADPHPGNIFLLENGALGLIDFGQAGHLSVELRQQLAVTLVALGQGDLDTVADVYAEIAGVRDSTDMRRFRADLISLVDRYYGVPMDRIDMRRVFEETVAVAREHGVYLPRDLVLMGKSLVTVVSVAQQVDPGFRIDTVARPFTERILKTHLHPGRLLKGGMFSFYRYLTLFRNTPRDLRDLVHKLRSGNLRLIFHHEALDDLNTHLDKASSRLSLAMVLGAIIVGSALVLSSEALATQRLPYVGEIPVAYVFGTFGFVAAIIIGFALVWSIIRGNRM
jgi:ubiquinone biosynthesis protein